ANPNALDHKFYTCFYPLNMGKIVPVMTQITDCEPKIVNDPIAGPVPSLNCTLTKKLLYYDSSNHLFPTRESTTTSISENEINLKDYVYLQDLNSPTNAEQELISQNKVLSPVEIHSQLQKD